MANYICYCVQNCFIKIQIEICLQWIFAVVKLNFNIWRRILVISRVEQEKSEDS